jgi:hypothetical protein
MGKLQKLKTEENDLVDFENYILDSLQDNDRAKYEQFFKQSESRILNNILNKSQEKHQFAFFKLAFFFSFLFIIIAVFSISIISIKPFKSKINDYYADKEIDNTIEEIDKTMVLLTEDEDYLNSWDNDLNDL